MSPQTNTNQRQQLVISLTGLVGKLARQLNDEQRDFLVTLDFLEHRIRAYRAATVTRTVIDPNWKEDDDLL